VAVTVSTRSLRGRRGHGEQTREEILAAAEALLVASASEEEVSVRAVAEAVGVTPPAIYRHFPDKATLIFEVCARQFDRLADEVATTVRPDGDPIDTLVALARAYARFGTENPEHYRIMFMGHADHTPEQYADAGVLETGSFGFLVQVVQQALDDGRLRPEAGDALRVSTTLWEGIHGVVSLAVAKPNLPGPPFGERVDGMLEALLHGIVRTDADR
jgi:AcrR family transcriptional regulator